MDVTLQWDAVQQPDITGYWVYYDTNSGDAYIGIGATEGTSPVDITLLEDENASPILFETTVHGLSAADAWYFAVKVYDNVGRTSIYSNEVSTIGPLAPGIKIIRVR